MKKLFFILSLLILQSFSVKSQSFDYYYDDAGNRYQRKTIFMFHSMQIDSTEEQVNGITVLLAPNPTSEKVFVSVAKVSENATDLNPVTTLSLYDYKGTLISTQQMNNSSTSVDLVNLANGSYILMILNGKKKKEVKIVKQ
jgi:hypothetical protein